MKIIIIGNGFDLNLGLKTSYKDFIESDYFIYLIKHDNSLATYLMSKTNLNNWVDIEKEITNYSRQVKDEVLNVKKDFFALKRALTSYLKEIQNKEINQESQAFEMIKNEIETSDMIYNFNYTNSVFRVAKILGLDYDLERKHSYVHGSIDNSDIILGVEDKARIPSNHIFFKKAYNINFGKTDIGKSLNRENDLVLFGHSLGITDSSYFLRYIRSLTSNVRISELKFYYYGEKGYDEMMQAIDRYTSNNLTQFKNNNKFIPIDSSEISILTLNI